MHYGAVLQGEANGLAQIAHMAKLWYAGFERKLMHTPLAPLGNIRNLASNSDAVLDQHDAEHGRDSPLRH